MSLKYVSIVARIRNAIDNLCVKSNDPKVIAKYIDTYGLYNALLGTDKSEGYMMVVAGVDGKEEDTHICLMVGAMVPKNHKMDYGAVIKRFEDTLCPANNKSMFWSHDATYIIIDDDHSNMEWWNQNIQEMRQCYKIEIWP